MKKIYLALMACVMVLGLGAQTLPRNLSSIELTIENSETGDVVLVKNLTYELLESWFTVEGTFRDPGKVVLEYKFKIREHNNPHFLTSFIFLNIANRDTFWRDLPQLKLHIPGIEQPISTGMTEAEIVAILGQPTKKSGNGFFHYEYGITRNFKISFEKQANGPARVLDIHF